MDRILSNSQFSYTQDRRKLLQNRQRLPCCLLYTVWTTAGCGRILDSYLQVETLIEGLIALHTFISTRKPDTASSLKAHHKVQSA
jgi:hypothetical protein